MAYRYNRINWQNSPSVATPLSAENLNKMDKGIDDNDKAIGDLVQLNTLNKSSLVSAVNELNNNLAGKILFTQGVISANTNFNEVGNEIRRGWLADYSGLVNAPADITTYNGYVLILESIIIDTSYKKQTLTVYASAGILSKIYIRCGYGSSWGQWRSISFT